MMVKGAALSYAIVFLLLVGLICSSLLFINATQKRVEYYFTTDEHLLLDSYSAIQKGIHTLEIGDTVIETHPFGDTSNIRCSLWGSIRLITVETFRGNKKKERFALVGQLPNDPTAFYLQGNVGSLKIAGNTLLEGEIAVPKKQIETTYLNEKPYKNTFLYRGDLTESKNELPELKDEIRNFDLQKLTKGLRSKAYLAYDSIYSFLNKTTYYQSVTPLYIENKITGNVIIHSFDSIVVSAKAQLKNVILIAPRITFEQGFKGSLQAFASETIFLSEDVQLTYPSFICLQETKNKRPLAKCLMEVGPNSIVLGGILLTTDAYDFRNPPTLKLSEKCTVAGLIYNDGQSELAGSIIGSVYTANLILHYGGGTYTNHLLDVLISSRRLPASFCFPDWLKTERKSTQKIISWL